MHDLLWGNHRGGIGNKLFTCPGQGYIQSFKKASSWCWNPQVCSTKRNPTQKKQWMQKPYTTFTMQDSSGAMVTITSERGRRGHNTTNMAVLATISLSALLLQENNIHSTSLGGWKPSGFGWSLGCPQKKPWNKSRTWWEVKTCFVSLHLEFSLASLCPRHVEDRFYSFSEWKSTSRLERIKILLTLIQTSCIQRANSNEAVGHWHPVLSHYLVIYRLLIFSYYQFT